MREIRKNLRSRIGSRTTVEGGNRCGAPLLASAVLEVFVAEIIVSLRVQSLRLYWKRASRQSANQRARNRPLNSQSGIPDLDWKMRNVGTPSWVPGRAHRRKPRAGTPTLRCQVIAGAKRQSRTEDKGEKPHRKVQSAEQEEKQR
jgi:hypothetical protein